jgi:hypothetical protein
VTLSTFLQPPWLAVLLVWSFIVLSAVQLTVRLIRAFSIPQTAIGALVLSVLTLAVSLVYDLLVGPDPSFTRRLELVPIAMLLMGLAGFAVLRWVLRFRRLRGQVAGAFMVGLLDPHLFVLIAR